MSEPAQPLSRRERRAMEEAARAAEGEMTQALPVASSPEPESIMSRRERRRLERLASPVETWTEEEELIATGQMPAMTPEVLAEQDRLAHERAAAAAFAETSPEPVAEPVVPDAVAEPEPEVAPEPAPEAAPEPEPEPEPAPEPEPEPAPVVQEAPSAIPADLRHLFPPGSLQARAFEAQQQATAPQATNEGDVDEIRRLTHEAMAGITRASTGAVPEATQPEPEAHAEPEPEGQPEPQPQPASALDVPELPDGVDFEELWNAPTVDEPIRESILPQAAPAEQAPVDLADAPFVQDIPVPTEPQRDGGTGVTPVWSALVPATPIPALPEQQAAPVAGEAPAPTMWDSHPFINPGATPVRELPAEPVQRELPRPDLSALLNTQANPTVGQQAELRSTEPLTSSGALPQRIAEPAAGGGARHFRWAHLAVIGALAFVLGVLAWNIAKSGS